MASTGCQAKCPDFAAGCGRVELRAGLSLRSWWLPPLLADLPGVEPDLLPVQTVPRGAILFREGEPAAGMWYLAAGWVKLVREAPDGRERVLWVKRPGDYVAEGTLTLQSVYPASAVALAPLRAVLIPRERWALLVCRYPQLAAGLNAILIRALAAAQVRLRDQSGPVLERVARLLLDLAQGPEALPLRHEDVAALVGASRERVSRALAHLRREGLIAGGPRRLRVQRDRLGRWLQDRE
ncbi:cAMP-binding proteins - catabolite gene activator and regulatory subunit of cAMP-dependent protein kinases [Candidatus Hydrogenisulfobacillus filiaventi]|uniref:cAMP-binding proteins - catabolite gene activator and regulatory subunit of cAMP-dependent protein kinases n=1 Tax=Candidatus Hydrogenisulfobacillus filiaventi TaxID=2707344 RepID=A0A6F8ZEL8_9FIRM|nr:Crp/Fnr family transcriptional regulator [Bacillota bacterium]CAB1128446.1 cAMP-binding proteins - catabolite gene activator and regulatory subunit of cAMP-dependent protein kinases [Candidatus Hydrogenisulfobacillus filiaventi]